MTEEVIRHEDESIQRFGNGHPVGLMYLFFAELWERFSFYGMRALLTLYLVSLSIDQLGKEEADLKAIGIYAAYGSLVYATPLLGGWLADRFLGFRKAIFWGGILMALGHFVMAVENNTALFAALGLLIVGNGFFKPNISSFVGSLYRDNDPNREAGFTIFYLGINVGAFLSPLLCGYLGEKYGWHYGFGLAGLGMLVGLIFFWIGNRKGVFGNQGYAPLKYREEKLGGQGGRNVDLPIYLLSLLSVPAFAWLVYANNMMFGNLELMGIIVALVFAVALIGSIIIMVQSGWVAAQKIMVILFITFLLTVFWAFFEQAGTSITLFAERNVNLFGMNAAQTNSINAGFIMLFAIPFAAMWTYLSKRKKNPRTPIKYALGIAQLGLGFLLFAVSAQFMDDVGKVPMLFLFAGYLFITTGELFVSPIGLSKVTELAPKKAVAFFMGIFFLSSMGAHYIGGVIAKLTAGEGATDLGSFWGPIVQTVTGFQNGVSDSAIEGVRSLAVYTSVFTQIAVVSFATALLTLILAPLINRLMHDVN